MYSHGTPSGEEFWIDSAKNHPKAARRIRSRRFSLENDLLTFALAART